MCTQVPWLPEHFWPVKFRMELRMYWVKADCSPACMKMESALVNSDPDFVVLGEGRNFTLEMVQRAVDMILAGAKLVTTNRDPSPKKKGWDNLGIASTTAMIEEATGIKAFVVGKPSPVMMRSARKALGLETAETTIIGDTMDTDIRGGVQMAYKTILVLSGITKREHLIRYAYKPDMVIDSVNDLTLPLPWWNQ
jgi:NagD protein